MESEHLFHVLVKSQHMGNNPSAKWVGIFVSIIPKTLHQSNVDIRCILIVLLSFLSLLPSLLRFCDSVHFRKWILHQGFVVFGYCCTFFGSFFVVSLGYIISSSPKPFFFFGWMFVRFFKSFLLSCIYFYIHFDSVVTIVIIVMIDVFGSVLFFFLLSLERLCRYLFIVYIFV